MSVTVMRSLSCDAAKVPGWEYQTDCTATFGPRAMSKRELRDEARLDDGWSVEGKFDLCEKHSCPFTHAHTRHWCGYPFCRES